jgi:hypothetical protein
MALGKGSVEAFDDDTCLSDVFAISHVDDSLVVSRHAPSKE